MMHLMGRVLWLLVYPILKLLEPCIQRWVKPTNQSVVLGTVADLTRTQSRQETTPTDEQRPAAVGAAGTAVALLESGLDDRST